MDEVTWTGLMALLFLLLALPIVVKNYLLYKKLAAIKHTSFKFAFKPIFILCTAPLMILSYPFFMVFRQIVDLILAYKLGSKYGGLLDGRDAAFNLENNNPGHSVFIIKYPSNRSQDFYDAVKDAVYKAFESNRNPKIFGAVRSFLGYFYIAKDEITLDDCFKKLHTMKVPIRRDDLIEAIEEYTSVPLPKNREALWDVFVGTQPVRWMDDSKGEEAQYYPVVVRVNHALADFGHLANGIAQLFADNLNIRFKCEAHVYQKQKQSSTGQQSLMLRLSNFCKNVKKMVKFYLRELYLMFIAPSVWLVNSLVMTDRSNILHGPNITLNKHLLTYIDPSSYYVELVKRIKKKIPNSTFEDICLTALIASIKDFYQKFHGSTLIPECITAEIPAVALSLIKPEKVRDEEMICRNRLSLYVCQFPININSDATKPLRNLLQVISKETSLIKKSLEFEANYFTLRTIFRVLPNVILRLLVKIGQDCTIFVSNMPGFAVSTVLGGCPIQDVCVWTPHRGKTGVGFLIFELEKRIQLSLSIDKALGFDKSEVRGLVDGFFKYLHLLEEETM